MNLNQGAGKAGQARAPTLRRSDPQIRIG